VKIKNRELKCGRVSFEDLTSVLPTMGALGHPPVQAQARRELQGREEQTTNY